MGKATRKDSLGVDFFRIGEKTTMNIVDAVQQRKSIRHFIIAIAIGYPDNDFPANKVVSNREAVDNITAWRGF